MDSHFALGLVLMSCITFLYMTNIRIIDAKTLNYRWIWMFMPLIVYIVSFITTDEVCILAIISIVILQIQKQVGLMEVIKNETTEEYLDCDVPKIDIETTQTKQEEEHEPLAFKDPLPHLNIYDENNYLNVTVRHKFLVEEEQDDIYYDAQGMLI